MKVNLHTNFYNINSIYKNKPTFKGKDTDTEKDFGTNKLIPIDTKKGDETDSFYDEAYEDGYDEGYKDGSKFNKFGIFVLGALSVLNLAFTKLSMDTNNANTAELNYKIAESHYDLSQKIDELNLDMNLNDATLLNNMLNMFIELQEQQNTIKKQIEALPEDSEEAQALKEELKAIEKLYMELEQKYLDFIRENPDKKDDTDKNDTPNDTTDDSVIYLKA